MEPVQAVEIAGSVAAHAGHLSIVGLFLQADIVVKSVMLMLVGESVWSWAIMFNKVSLLRGIFKRSEKFEDAFWSTSSVDDLYTKIGQQPKDPKAAIFCAAMREWEHSSHLLKDGDDSIKDNLHQRIDRVMRVTMTRELEFIERSIPYLASVGSISPFVGLFGTVWGIMNSFAGIAASKNTSLAVVAPGIAEALFATALGLVAAIPAVLAYNKLSNDIDRFAGQLETFSDELSAILARRLETHK